MKTFVASDLHIGYEKANYDKIREFFEIARSEADKLVLNGDILDLWRMSFSKIYAEHKQLLDQINQVAEEIPVIWVKGNHDWNVPQKKFPRVEFCGTYDRNGIHFEHGDGFDLMKKKHGWAYKLIEFFCPPFYQLFFKSPSKIIKKEDEAMWFPMHDEAMWFAHQNHTNVIVGHSHSPQIKWSRGYFVADCGDFIDSCSCLIINNDSVKLMKV